MEIQSYPVTAQELERVYLPDASTELVRGQLMVREPPSPRHGRVQAKLRSPPI